MAKSLFYKPLAILIIEESYLQRFFHTLPQDEEARLFTCIRAYNELKKNLKSPDSLRAKYITISLDGTMVNIVFPPQMILVLTKKGLLLTRLTEI